MFQKLIYGLQFVRSLGNRYFHAVFVKVKFIKQIQISNKLNISLAVYTAADLDV